uniref:NADH-ubiquinone oxidoreductase chain 4 n=1 Tax=Trixagus sp. TRI01 TaxID=1205587 RepID=A0A0S2MQA6_9COLE|nr:NADH deshydrogenase subunit 4 [Trixagus sp. TRI01]
MMSLLMLMILLIFVSMQLEFWVISLFYFLMMGLLMLYNIGLNTSLLSMEMGLDYWSFFFVILSLWICVLMIISSGLLYKKKYSWSIFVVMNLLIMLLLFLVFVSLNFFLFYLFFEASLVPTFILIIGWGYQPERLQAGFYMLLYTLFVSLPMMISIFYLFFNVGSLIFNFMSINFSLYLYLCMSLVFFVKFPIFLIHLWLPKAHVEAPVSGSMILAGVMLKLGGYGLVRMLSISSSSVMGFSMFFMSLGLVGGFFVSLICLCQFDMKSLVAYSSVAHMGLVISGILTMSITGVMGSLILMLAHGLCSSGLFCLTNMVYERTMSRSLFINKGMMLVMPFLSLWWFIFCIFNMSAPPSLNLLGELILFMSMLNWESSLLVFISLISFFGAFYSLYLFSLSQHGKMMISVYLFWPNSIREHILMFLHFFPLILFILSGY